MMSSWGVVFLLVWPLRSPVLRKVPRGRVLALGNRGHCLLGTPDPFGSPNHVQPHPGEAELSLGSPDPAGPPASGAVGRRGRATRCRMQTVPQFPVPRGAEKI